MKSFRKMATKALALGLLATGLAGSAGAATLTFDFEGGGAGTRSTEGYVNLGFGNSYLWSSGAPVTQGFMQTGGSTIDLAFNLAVIDTWDGSNWSWGSNDYFNVKLDDTLVFRETFNYLIPSAQSYSASAPLTWGSGLAMGGAQDTAYLITLNGLASGTGSHTLTFFADGNGWQGTYNPLNPQWGPGNPMDESFAVDNIRISHQDPDPTRVPEPSTMLLLGSGLVALAGRRLRRQS